MKKKPEDGPNHVFNITARVNWSMFHLDPELHARHFLRALARCATQFTMSILGYVTMGNHFHFVVQCPPDPVFERMTTRKSACRHRVPYPLGHLKRSALSQLMHQVMWRTSWKIQRELGVKGQFWEEPYHATWIQDADHLVIALAYDHLNPVRQKMVERAEAYDRSSAAWWAGRGSSEIRLLRWPLPFGLKFEELRRPLLHFQNREEAIAVLDAIDATGLPADPAARRARLRRILGEHGLWPLRNPSPHSDDVSD